MRSINLDKTRFYDDNLDIPAGLRGSDYYSVNKFGRTTNLDSGSANDTDIWDRSITGSNRIWVALASAETIDLISTVAGTDNSTGTGARKVHVYGLDANWDLQDEEVTLSGTQRTIGTYIRVFRMKVMEWGTDKVNAGNIRGQGSGSGIVQAQINVGNNQTLMAIYTIPNGYTAFMTRYYCSVNRNSPSNVSFDLELLVKEDADVANNGYQIKSFRGMFINTGHLEHPHTPYMRIEQKSDVVMRGSDCTDNNTDVVAGFDLIVVKNTAL